MLALARWCFLACSIVAIVASSSMAAEAAGLEQCEADHPLSQSNRHAALARGFNLPNWEPDHDGLKPDDSLLAYLLQAGFTHIRLPVNGDKLITRFTAKDQGDAYLAHLQSYVLRLHKLGYSVSVDMHPGYQFQRAHGTAPEDGYKLLRQAWERIAVLAKDWPKDSIYFELLNEPVPDQSIWWEQAERLAQHLNKIAQGRPLIIGPAVFQRIEPLLAAEPIQADNVIYAIHFYDPFVFTHQAMSWDPGSYVSRLRQLPFPADANTPGVVAQIERMQLAGELEAVQDLKDTYKDRWDAERIAKILGEVGEWSRKNNAAVIINEFGVLNFDVDLWARADWLRAVRKGAEAACLGWAHWDFSDGFAMVDPQTTLPDAFVLDALLSK